MSLKETQALFYQLVTRGPGSATRAELDGVFVADADRPVDERLQIYANMYLWRLCDALRDDFPKLARLLGENRFFALAAAYVRERPSEHHDIGRFGRELPAFVRANPQHCERPDAVDLAALEWARAEVFHEAHAEPLGRHVFARVQGDAFASARLQLVPALRLLRLEHDAVSLFRRLDDDQAPLDPLPENNAVVVWRPQHEVFHSRLSLEEADALERAMRGAALAEVCSAFQSCAEPADAAFAALSSWLDEGFVAALI